MEPQTTGHQTKLKGTTEALSPASEYTQQDVVNIRLPRKRVALMDVEIDLAALPKRKPHIVPGKESEEAE
ncbi:MAG TPA: hypothetical protein VFB21_13950 [Chthonomonadaceae bacterium]|nr:hypothetical protein [Chthonomonadaceae bacterium]